MEINQLEFIYLVLTEKGSRQLKIYFPISTVIDGSYYYIFMTVRFAL